MVDFSTSKRLSSLVSVLGPLAPLYFFVGSCGVGWASTLSEAVVRAVFRNFAPMSADNAAYSVAVEFAGCCACNPANRDCSRTVVKAMKMSLVVLFIDGGSFSAWNGNGVVLSIVDHRHSIDGKSPRQKWFVLQQPTNCSPSCLISRQGDFEIAISGIKSLEIPLARPERASTVRLCFA